MGPNASGVWIGAAVPSGSKPNNPGPLGHAPSLYPTLRHVVPRSVPLCSYFQTLASERSCNGPPNPMRAALGLGDIVFATVARSCTLLTITLYVFAGKFPTVRTTLLLPAPNAAPVIGMLAPEDRK